MLEGAKRPVAADEHHWYLYAVRWLFAPPDCALACARALRMLREPCEKGAVVPAAGETPRGGPSARRCFHASYSHEATRGFVLWRERWECRYKALRGERGELVVTLVENFAH